MYENPSAGKFEPPPPPAQPRPERWNGAPVMTVVLVALVWWVVHWRPSSGRRGWVEVIGAIITLGAGLFEFVNRTGRSDDDGDEPYTPPTHLTR